MESVSTQSTKDNSIITRNDVLEILKQDATFRYPKVNDGLIKYDNKEMNVSSKWDYSLPTLVSSASQRNAVTKLPSAEEVLEKIRDLIPSSVDMSNVLLAGGFVVSKISDSGIYDSSKSDLDFFIYGLSEDEATKRAKKLLKDLYPALEKHYLTLHTLNVSPVGNFYILPLI